MKLIDFIENFEQLYGGCDVDVCDDYDETCYIAYCGTQLTAAGYEEFRDVLLLDLIDEGDELKKQFESGTVILNVCKHEEPKWILKKLIELFYSMAGYVDNKLWDKWFKEDEEL